LTLPQAIKDREPRQGQPIKQSEAGKGPERVWREAEGLFWQKMGEMKEAKK
jgi:saccharopine dehydrogenase (NAD+, L-lysine-forming)